MLNSIYKALQKPQLYTKTNTPFWNDEYISRQMLKAHLSPDFEGASRKLSFINQSVEWIAQIVSPKDHPLLIDIGCGPGIYAERFFQKGYQVTGIDFSKRSIDYAKKSANEKGMSIEYLFQNYLEMEIEQVFDFATMIYCDYGALSDIDRKKIMTKSYHCLRQGGKFLLDVFSIAKYNRFQEKQIWEVCPNNGFWREDKYVALNGHYKYPPNVTLEQIAIISEDTVTPYYLWTTYFSTANLIKEAEEIGFKVCEIFGDVAGAPYTDNSSTLAILLEK